MVSPEKRERLVQKIDSWVKQSIDQGGGDEELLESISDFMPTFKRIMDGSTQREMDFLAMKYDGFYKFANLLENLAEAIADGWINPDEFETKPKKPKGKGFG